jgi:beta-ketoacyl-acyl-carrier-protein synthase II
VSEARPPRERSGDDVVVTGMGAITPAGRGVEATWQGALAGVATATHDERLAAAGATMAISCRAPHVDVDAELGRGSVRRLDRFTHLAVVAAREAIAQAGLTSEDPDVITNIDPDRAGVVIGTGIGGGESWETEYARLTAEGPTRVSPLFVPRMLSNTAAGTIAIRTHARGPNLTVNTACAAGASAIHVGRDLIRSGQADIVLAGGVEAGITTIAISAFAQMGALSSNPDPSAASRPFDVARDGFVMGEGAGIVVLESRAHAEARGATPLFTVAGCGASADAFHATAPPEDGGGAALAMQRAISDSGIDPIRIGHHNAHGTSTPLNDIAETRALRTVFGAHLSDVVVTSTKGVTGHLLGAAGAVEAILAACALRDGLVPPTANLTVQDPEIELDVVSGSPRKVRLEAVISASMGFGGQNAALVLTPA